MWTFCVQKDADLFSKENANSWSKRRTILKFKIWTSTGTNISMSPTSLYLYRCVIESVMPRTQQDCNDKMWRSQDRPKLILSLVVASDSKVIFLQSWTTLNIWSRTLIRKKRIFKKVIFKRENEWKWYFNGDWRWTDWLWSGCNFNIFHFYCSGTWWSLLYTGKLSVLSISDGSEFSAV